MGKTKNILIFWINTKQYNVLPIKKVIPVHSMHGNLQSSWP